MKKSLSGSAIAAILAAAVVACGGPAGKTPVVLYDFHHHQPVGETHGGGWYGAADTSRYGYSEVIGDLDGLYDFRMFQEPITDNLLAGGDMLFIINPDLPKHVGRPNYLSETEADAVERFVRSGGGLVVLGNSVGESEIEHLNGLLGRFGFVFRADSSGIAEIAVQSHPRLGDQGIFSFMNGCSSEILDPDLGRAVEPLLFYEDAGVKKAAAVLAYAGEGRVLALGDCGCFLNGTVERLPHNRKFFKLFFDLVAPGRGG